VVWEPIPGAEEDNARHLVRAGAARWPATERALGTAIHEILDGAGAEMAEAGRRVVRPGAAARIAQLLEARC
jgi:UDP-N-acetylglucosamine:LPS N-acetylglucosamine transferase